MIIRKAVWGMKKKIIKYRGVYVVGIIIIMLVGMALRIICCNWGAPLQIHPDEPTIIDSAIDMLRRHSWEASVYNRPDHFEIKCDALLFSVFSWLKYKMPAYEAFADHKMTFYWLGRFYTALFGTAMIPLIAYYVGQLMGAIRYKYKVIAQVVAALMVALSYIYVQHSAYATPDVVLSFFVLLFSCLLAKYIENGNKRLLYISAGIIGISVTIKYPAAIMCIPLALVEIYAEIKAGKPIQIIRKGMICIFIVVSMAFILAPNLFTNIQTTYNTFVKEARPTHLGADGLGFIGNLKYYADICIQYWSQISLGFFCLGILILLVMRDNKHLSLLSGVILWICLSILSLHWLRWGLPFYTFYVVIIAIGIGGTIAKIDQWLVKWKAVRICSRIILFVCSGVMILSVAFSGVCLTVWSSLPDVRIEALAYVNQSGIMAEDCISEGATPFIPGYANPRFDSFEIIADKIQPKIEYAVKHYYVMSNSFKNRYMADKNRYPEECFVYEKLDEQYDKAYQMKSDGNLRIAKEPITNIVNCVSYLLRSKKSTGDIITIYDLNPNTVTVKSISSNKYLGASDNQSGGAIVLQEDPYEWVIYKGANGLITLISQSANLSLDITGARFVPGTELELWKITGEKAQQWALEGESQCSFVAENGMALSCGDEKVCLAQYDGNNTQLWYVDKVDY